MNKPLSWISGACLAAMLTPAHSAPIHFALGGNGDLSQLEQTGTWAETTLGAFVKDTDALVSQFSANIEGTDVGVSISTQSTGVKSLLLSKFKGIGLNGNGSGGINGHEIMSISFDKDVYLNTLLFKDVSLIDTIHYRLGQGSWRDIHELTSGPIGHQLAAYDALELKVANGNIDESFRLEGVDISLTAPRSTAPAGNYIRLRAFQNAGYTKLEGNFWALQGRNAHDVFDIIEETKPAELERFISGPLGGQSLVPVRAGEPEMTTIEFLDEVSERCDCVITPRVSLHYYNAPNTWSSEYPDNTFWAVAENLYNLPLKKPLRKISIDNWGDFSKNYDDKEIDALLQRLKEMGWEIASNMIGGNINSYGKISEAAFGVNHETFMPQLHALKNIVLNESIDGAILYIDFQSPADQFVQLPVDEQADKLIEIAKRQDQYGYTFLWPVQNNGDWWDLQTTYTSIDGPYQGKSLYKIMLEWLDPTQAHTPSPFNKAKDIELATTLIWNAGLKTRMNSVYLGTNPDDMNLVCATDEARCHVDLQPGQNYYWRVDNENNFGTLRGNTWQFSSKRQLISNVISASADSFLKAHEPTINFGSKMHLATGKATKTDTRLSLVKFSLAQTTINELISAKVSIFVERKDQKLVELYLADNNWSESTVTWANKPTQGESAIASATTSAGNWLTFDVTKQVSLGNEVSFYLTSNIGSLIKFSSKESGRAPQLQLTGY